MPLTINNKIQFIKILKNNNLILSSLSSNIASQISVIYGIGSDGESYISWDGSAFSSLSTLETFKTYLVISNSDNPNYSLYTDNDTIDSNPNTNISQRFQMETYTGSAPITLNSATFINNIQFIYGGGAAYSSFEPNNSFNSLTQLQQNNGYLFITNGQSFALSSNNSNTVTPTPTNTPTPTSIMFTQTITIQSGVGYVSGDGGLTFAANIGDRLSYTNQIGLDLPATMNIVIGGVVKATVIFPSSLYFGKPFRFFLNETSTNYIGNFIAGIVNF